MYITTIMDIILPLARIMQCGHCTTCPYTSWGDFREYSCVYQASDPQVHWHFVLFIMCNDTHTCCIADKVNISNYIHACAIVNLME